MCFAFVGGRGGWRVFFWGISNENKSSAAASASVNAIEPDVSPRIYIGISKFANRGIQSVRIDSV